MKKILLSCFIILLALPAMTQETENLEQMLDDGFFFFQEEDYQEAIFYLLKLEGTRYDNANVQFKTGMCYLNIPGQEYKAIPYLEKALNDLTGKYSARSTDETSAPYHTWFFLGRAYRINNQLEEALEAFNSFKEVPGFEKNYNLRIVDNEINACEIAKIIQDIPVEVRIDNLGSTINNESDNYYPVISADGQTLVFMSDLKFYDAIFMSKRTAGVWGEPVNITPQVQSDGDAIPSYLSPDGTELLLIKGTGNNRDIYYSRFEDGFWTKMESFSPQINSNRAESYASLSKDGNTILFTSNRRGGEGEFDIYSAKKDVSGQWTSPENLGPVINTPFNEASPYLSEDGNTLFFTSEGHYNMGGYDIFYSTRKSNGEWDDPVNMGYPINTTSDNTFYYPLENGRFGYISRILPEGFGGQDIYRIERIAGKAEGTELIRGEIGDTLSLTEPFVIRVFDQGTGQMVTEIQYDPVKKKFTYQTRLKNLKHSIEKK